MTTIKKYTDKNGDTKYQFQIYVGKDPRTGKDIRTRRRGFDTKKEAQLSLSRLELEIEERGLQQQDNSKFSDIYELWFTQYQQTVKESTWATTQRIFDNHILPVFKDYRITKIDVPTCQQALNPWFKAGFKKYHTYLNYVGMVMEFAIGMQLIHDNPTQHVIIPKNKTDYERKNLENYYDRDELKHFFDCLQDDAINPQAYVFFRLAAFSGMRKSEMLVLTWQDVDFVHHTISVNKSQSKGDNNRLLVQSPKTKRSMRTVYLDSKTMQILHDWQHQQKEFLLAQGFNQINLIFSNEENQMFQPTKPRIWLRHVIERYDLKPVTVHAFRHTYATLPLHLGLVSSLFKNNLATRLIRPQWTSTRQRRSKNKMKPLRN
ncbi:site-specific integrase [Lentilactobacillus sp. Marseille-Q4993]|uniref:tyrosine-type recombinase/integrase n=1 Tax=Lentilactobacillus sp. Marseille-Q4993 TaxID=3039492 RepID=UPI0024BD177C|nr:site-specific integrase [Lentilactobacillus sp. Marseille-Q4993]